MRTSPVAIQQLRADLAGAELREIITKLVWSRVPSADADDVVQTTMCAALSATNVPEEPGRRARWVVGIARHKIADYYRRTSRFEHGDYVAPLEATPSYEARDLLASIARDAEADARAQQTLEWIVREHGGERLAEIAREEKQTPAAVRQRVSRLRRALRARWLAAALALCAVVAVSRAWLAPSTRLETGAMTRTDIQGRWSVKSIRGVPVDGMVAAVSGDQITVGDMRGTLRVEDGTFLVTDGKLEVRAQVVRAEGDDMVLLVETGEWVGEIALRRMR